MCGESRKPSSEDNERYTSDRFKPTTCRLFCGKKNARLPTDYLHAVKVLSVRPKRASRPSSVRIEPSFTQKRQRNAMVNEATKDAADESIDIEVGR